MNLISFSFYIIAMVRILINLQNNKEESTLGHILLTSSLFFWPLLFNLWLGARELSREVQRVPCSLPEYYEEELLLFSFFLFLSTTAISSLARGQAVNKDLKKDSDGTSMSAHRSFTTQRQTGSH